MKNSIFKLWKEVGILDGLSDKDAHYLAEKFNECAEYLIKLITFVVENKKDKNIESFIFPIIRRIFLEKREIDVRDVYLELSR